MSPYSPGRAISIALACAIPMFVAALWIYTPQQAAALACTHPGNLVINGCMNAPAGASYATGWSPFVLSGEPDYDHVTNEDYDRDGSGSQYIQGASDFDAGIYQRVSGLTPGATYRYWLAFALAAYDPGNQQNARGDWIGRRIGYDPTGGTDPTSPAIQWGQVYWDGVAAQKIPELDMTFTAQTSSVTLYLRATNTQFEPMNKVWFDGVCMEQVATASAPPPPPLGPYLVFLPLVTHYPMPIAC